jgi:hypothetical protein
VIDPMPTDRTHPNRTEAWIAAPTVLVMKEPSWIQG